MLHHLEKLPATPGGLPWAVGFVCWWAASAGQESLPGGVDSDWGAGWGRESRPLGFCPGPGIEGGVPRGGEGRWGWKDVGAPTDGPCASGSWTVLDGHCCP